MVMSSSNGNSFPQCSQPCISICSLMVSCPVAKSPGMSFSYSTHPFAFVAEKIGLGDLCRQVGLGEGNAARVQKNLAMKACDLGRLPQPTIKLYGFPPFVGTFPQTAPALIALEGAILAS